MIKALIVADDLTGALDTATPFALGGERVVCVTHPSGIAAALSEPTDILVVTTGSRALSPADATEAVTLVGREVLRHLGGQRPPLVFKKIDSRLKGNVAAETEALAEIFGFKHLLVAPAVPDQGRLTISGAVQGRGVDTPLPIAPVFAPLKRDLTIADAEDATALAQVVASTDWTATLAVGARGLGLAFAAEATTGPSHAFTPHRDTLLAIGSRDPITEAQVARLEGVEIAPAPMGVSEALPERLPAALVATGPFAGADAALSRRFAEGVVAALQKLSPDTLVLSGGDTALAVLDRLGIDLIRPQGEAAPGLPWFLMSLGEGRNLRAIVKSGGFGERTALAALIPGA